jgi:hypothetical protein
VALRLYVDDDLVEAHRVADGADTEPLHANGAQP